MIEMKRKSIEEIISPSIEIVQVEFCYTVWDTRAAGLGVRVRPSGYRAYVYHDNRGRHTLGAVALMSAEAARGKCLAVQLTTAEPGEDMKGGRAPRFRDFVAGEWKKAHYDRCKPSTRKGTDSALKSQLLPAFGALPLERITPIDVKPVVRRVQRHIAGRRELDIRDTAPGPQSCDGPWLPRNQPGPGREDEPPPEAHPVPVER